MRRVQARQHGDRRSRVSGVLGIGESQHRAVAGVGHQQHAARTEGHLPCIRRGGENGNMESGGSFRRVKSSFSEWLQESHSKGNRAQITGAREPPILEHHAGKLRGWCAWRTAQELPDYRNFLQPWAHAVFISDFAKITRHCAFSLPPVEAAALQCVVG